MAAEFQRDRWGRPLIIPTGGGKPLAYSRFSSHGQVLEDRFGLEKWKIRTSALGLVARQDLFAQLASIPSDDSKRIDEILSQALEAGGGSVGANMGTALHEFTQRYDLGEITLADIPDPWRADVEAYARTIADHGLEIRRDLIEVTLVNDALQLAGTADRFFLDGNGRLICSDLKTGKSIGPNPLGYIVQLAAYANSVLYDVETGVRTPLGDVDLDHGLLIHAPAQQARCDLYRVDLRGGLEAAQLATRVKKWQKRKDLVAIQAPPTPDLTESNVEALLTAFPGSVVLGSDSRRQWLKDRIQRLISIAEAKQELVALWPIDVPKLSGDHPHTDLELDAIIEIVDALEAAHELPWFGIDPNHPPLETDRQAKRKVVKSKNPKAHFIDEGPDISVDDVADIKRILDTEVNRQQLAFISRMADEAATAGAPISLRQMPSVRRMKITYALIDLAQATIDGTGDVELAEAMIRHIKPGLTELTIGGRLGHFTMQDADSLKKLVSDFNDDLIDIAINDDNILIIKQPQEVAK
jgi:hypothetical protein